MRNSLIFLVAVLLAMTSCKQMGNPDAVPLGVDFTFTGSHQCSSTSPEIRVTNIPADTKFLKVKLTDLNKMSWSHGGGTIPYSGSGVIPEGALKDGYNGPCPPGGSHTYSFSVQALGADKNVLGVGKAQQRFP